MIDDDYIKIATYFTFVVIYVIYLIWISVYSFNGLIMQISQLVIVFLRGKATATFAYNFRFFDRHKISRHISYGRPQTFARFDTLGVPLLSHPFDIFLGLETLQVSLQLSLSLLAHGVEHSEAFVGALDHLFSFLTPDNLLFTLIYACIRGRYLIISLTSISNSRRLVDDRRNRCTLRTRIS